MRKARIQFGIRHLLGFAFLMAVVMAVLNGGGWLRNNGVYCVTSAEMVTAEGHGEDLHNGEPFFWIDRYWVWTVQDGPKSMQVSGLPLPDGNAPNPLPVGTPLRFVRGSKFEGQADCIKLATFNGRFAMKLPPGSDTVSVKLTLAAIAFSAVAILVIDRVAFALRRNESSTETEGTPDAEPSTDQVAEET